LRAHETLENLRTTSQIASGATVKSQTVRKNIANASMLASNATNFVIAVIVTTLKRPRKI